MTARRHPRLIYSDELAARLGLSRDGFYRARPALHVDDGLPAPLSMRRPLRWDRPTIEAWFARHHPHAPKLRAANDAAPPAAPAGGEWGDYLQRVYGGRA